MEEAMRSITAVVMCLVASAVEAQSLNYAPFDDGLNPERIASGYSPPLITSGPVVPSQDYITLTRYPATGNTRATGFGYVSVGDLAVALSPQTGQAAGPSSLALATIASRLDHLADRFREGIALAGAINVLPPNPGDRFAVSFGGAGYDGAGAGSVAISARLNESTLAYVGYARGPTQNLVKGGVGFSFR